MPITVPDEPKTYTTIYNNFKGVDFTNDSSNVWRHRSPSGKNMLPNIDGVPYKRGGWDIELSAQDFRDAAGIVDSSIEVTSNKMYYFELGGYDYLMIFNNLGVFTYSPNPVDQSSSAFPMLLKFHNKYIDKSNVQQDFPPNGYAEIDPRRAFFFEGKGTAGFYVLVGMKMFRYDGTFFNEVEPYIPTIMIGTSYQGAGTLLESINMLTSKRMVTYSCDGTNRIHVVPGGIASGTHPKVEVLNQSTGAWVVQTENTAYVINYANGTIDFNAGYTPAKSTGDDNLRVTYEPDGVGATQDEKDTYLTEKTISITRTRTQTRSKTGTKGTPGAWTTTKTTYAYSSQAFNTPNLKYNHATKAREYTLQCRNSGNTDWTTMAAANHTDIWTSAQNKVTVKGTTALYNSSVPVTKTTSSTSNASAWKKKTGTKNTYTQTRTLKDTKYYRVRVRYTQFLYKSGAKENKSVTAFSQCTRALVFGSGIINQVFMSSTPYQEYNTRVWYSAATDPTYFPDTNYIEVGANDSPIMGMMKVGEYLGVIKQGTSFDTSIYLAYPTSFDDNTTFAVKQNINGIGAISNGAFNILNEEPLFLSAEGVMGIEVSESDTDRRLRNRSFFINKRLCAEPGLAQAISFVFKGLYYLCVNNRCYVLDGSQKNSWANTKTNLQYECYYLENIPAQCFGRMDDKLFFLDFKGNLCRFKSGNDNNIYRDEYSVGTPVWTVNVAPTPIQETIIDEEGNEKTVTRLVYSALSLTGDADLAPDQTIQYGDIWYTVTELRPDSCVVEKGVPIDAVWSTVADDDGAVHFFKNLNKKGCVVSLLPSSDSGVSVYIKADDKDPVKVGETDAKEFNLPFDFYTKKKIKKYKRLQFICENNVLDDSFGVDQIVKTYTMGNYSKNRG